LTSSNSAIQAAKQARSSKHTYNTIQQERQV
jgi:hypothetical protein